MHRRSFLLLGGIALTLGARIAHGTTAARPTTLDALCRRLESDSRGRLGVFLFDSRDGKEFLYRGAERFPMCSTFKWLAAAAVLAQVDTNRDSLERRIRFTTQALLDYSPITRAYSDGPGLSLAQLCEAAIADSDNTAANLLLDAISGPQGFNSFLRSRGDTSTRLDRNEPALNECKPGDPRDTTTPAAMGADLRRLLLEDGLSPTSRQQLIDWMLATRTSGKRLRANLEPGWRLADKTGTGQNGTANDVGIYWTPDGQPIVVCVYLTTAKSPLAMQESVIATLGKTLRKT